MYKIKVLVSVYCTRALRWRNKYAELIAAIHLLIPFGKSQEFWLKAVASMCVSILH